MAAVSLLDKWKVLQAIFADGSLPPSAKLVAGRLLYHHSAQTGRCSPSYQTLADGTALTRRRAIQGVQELEACGWLNVRRVKGGDPAAAKGFVTNSFDIAFDRADLVDTPVNETTLPPGEQIDTPPSADLFTPGVNETALGGVNKTTLNSGKDTGKGNRGVSPLIPSRFEEWWSAYPRKVKPDKAKPIFEKIVATGRASADEMIEGARRYAAEREGEPTKFTAHPTTWLNDGRWADEPTPPADARRNGHSPQSRRPFSATRDWLMAEVETDE